MFNLHLMGSHPINVYNSNVFSQLGATIFFDVPIDGIYEGLLSIRIGLPVSVSNALFA